MLETILAISTIIGGIAAIDYFWGKWGISAYILEIAQGLLNKFLSKPPVWKEFESTMPLESPFYVKRPPIESDCYERIAQDNALIRIKAPRKMGKTSLMAGILHHAQHHHNYRTAHISFREAERTIFADLDHFLHWFCTKVTSELEMSNKLDDYWQQKHQGDMDKCKDYFQKYLLSESQHPIVLGLDDVDQIFQYFEIASQFFGMLRAWHERQEDVWKKLRLILVYKVDDIPLDINKSPFNVGKFIKLPTLNALQLQDLVQQYQLNLSEEQITQFMGMFGGHPYLVQVALYQIARKRMTWTELLQIAPTELGPYAEYLHLFLSKLTENAFLSQEFKQIIDANTPISTEHLKQQLKLSDMGLIKIEDGNTVVPFCELYRIYFRNHIH